MNITKEKISERVKNPGEYTIVEVFKSFQGEGENLGMPAIFIRFAGCNLSCPFCDEPKHNNLEKVVFRGSATEFCTKYRPHFVGWGVEEKAPPMIILTGGEPTLYDLNMFITALRFFKLAKSGNRQAIAVETNGSQFKQLSLLDPFTFITISPKRTEDLKNIDFMRLSRGEVKIPISGDHFDFAEECISILSKAERSNPGCLNNFSVWLTPINYQTKISAENNAKSMQLIQKIADKYSFRFNKQLRANIQAHKIWGVE